MPYWERFGLCVLIYFGLIALWALWRDGVKERELAEHRFRVRRIMGFNKQGLPPIWEIEHASEEEWEKR